MNTTEVVMDMGDAISRVLRKHGIEPHEVRTKVEPDQIRIIVDLEEPE